MNESLACDDDTLRTAHIRPRGLGKVAWSASTSVGSRRADNQDYWGARNDRRFVVADGVGGSVGGAAASAAAVSAFLDLAPTQNWHSAMGRINRAVLEECSEQALPGAATTLVGCDIGASTTDIVHVGDSRAYHLTGGELQRLTVDHNLGEYLKAQGQDSVSSSDGTSLRALVSYLGADDQEQPIGVCEVTLAPGSRLLLCTDGVHEQVGQEQLINLLTSVDIADVAHQIVAAADAAGGRDNATALVLQRS